jgi:hypothetical protein
VLAAPEDADSRGAPKNALRPNSAGSVPQMSWNSLADFWL